MSRLRPRVLARGGQEHGMPVSTSLDTATAFATRGLRHARVDAGNEGAAQRRFRGVGRLHGNAVRRASAAAKLAIWAVPVFMALGLTARLLTYPLQKDEHLFVSVAALLGHGNLYLDLGYNHLPNLPLLLGGLYVLTGTEHYLLVGRLLMLGFWALSVLALWLLARKLQIGLPGFLTGVTLLLGNTLLLGTPGMLVSNNLPPIPLILLAFYFLLGAMRPEATSPWLAAAAGLCASLAIGMKANYVFIAPIFAAATLLAPSARRLPERITGALLPLAAGGLAGGLPALFYLLSDPDLFFAHTLT